MMCNNSVPEQAIWQEQVNDKRLREMRRSNPRATKKHVDKVLTKYLGEDEFEVQARNAWQDMKFEVQSSDSRIKTWILGRVLRHLDDHKKEYADKTIRILETVLVLIYDLCKAQNMTDRSIACLSFIQKYMSGPIISVGNIVGSMELIGQIAEKLKEYYDAMFGAPEVQSVDENFKFFHKLLDNYEQVRESALVKKLHRFAMYALSLSLFTKVGITFKNCNYDKFEAAAVKKKYTLGPSFVHCLFDTLLFIVERGYQCMISGRLDPIFHDDKSYTKWIQDCEELETQARYLADPEAARVILAKDPTVKIIDRFQYLANLDELIEKGEAIMVSVDKKQTWEVKALQSAICRLKTAKANEVTKRAAQMMRRAPFALLVYGGSSVGKSSFTDLIFYQVGKTLELPTTSEYKYTRNFADPFWSGYHPSMWFLILDDIAYLHPNKTPTGDPSLTEVIQILNRIPLITNQAELADKGKCPCRAKCVVATSNSQHLNANSNFTTPLALKRRFGYMVDVAPREEFTKDDQFMDAKKVSDWKVSRGDADIFDDLWCIKLFKLVPTKRAADGRDFREAQDGTYVRINDKDEMSDEFIFSDIYAFLAWLSRKCLEHEANEEMLDKAGVEAQRAPMCHKCFYPEVRCKCTKVQAVDDRDVANLEMRIAGYHAPVLGLASDPEPIPLEPLFNDAPSPGDLGKWLEYLHTMRVYRDSAWHAARHTFRDRKSVV